MVCPCSYCGTRSRQDGRTFHKFPAQDDPTLQLWLKNMVLGSSFILTEHSRLCSSHFEQKCFNRVGEQNYVRLHPGSVPTLFEENNKASCAFCHVLKSQDKTKSFHKFPLNDPSLLARWIEAMKLKNFIPDERSLLCSDHFEKTCFNLKDRNSTLLRLKRKMVPSIFPRAKKEGKNVTESINKPSREVSEKDSVIDPPSNDSEQQQKRVSSGDLSSPKIRRSHSLSTSQQSFEIINVTGEDYNGQSFSVISSSNEEASILTIPKTPPATLPTINKEFSNMEHDHRYQDSPKTMKKKLILYKNKIKMLQQQQAINKRQVSRLRKQVTSLKDIISQLRKDGHISPFVVLD